MLTTGIKGTKELKVTDELLAKNVGSGIVSVYATPMMIAGMEGTLPSLFQSILRLVKQLLVHL